jgi:hypothetical protein
MAQGEPLMAKSDRPLQDPAPQAGAAPAAPDQTRRRLLADAAKWTAAAPVVARWAAAAPVMTTLFDPNKARAEVSGGSLIP